MKSLHNRLKAWRKEKIRFYNFTRKIQKQYDLIAYPDEVMRFIKKLYKIDNNIRNIYKSIYFKNLDKTPIVSKKKVILPIDERWQSFLNKLSLVNLR